MTASHALILLVLGASSLVLASQLQAQPVARKVHTHHQAKPVQRQSSTQKEDALLAQLNLSPDQQAQIQTLRQQYETRLNRAKDQPLTPAERRKLQAEREGEIAQVLTPEQRTRWDQLHAAPSGTRAPHGNRGHHQAAASGLSTPNGGGK